MKDKVEMKTHPNSEIRSCVKSARNWKEITDTTAAVSVGYPD
jgi:hypothetical protein